VHDIYNKLAVFDVIFVSVPFSITI